MPTQRLKPGLATLLLFCLGWTVSCTPSDTPSNDAPDYPTVRLPPADQTLEGKQFSRDPGRVRTGRREDPGV